MFILLCDMRYLYYTILQNVFIVYVESHIKDEK